MVTNSYQGVNGVHGVNSFSGVNSLTGANSFGGVNTYGSPNDRLISESRITDPATRKYLADKFHRANSYSDVGVASIGDLRKPWEAPESWGRKPYEFQESQWDQALARNLPSGSAEPDPFAPAITRESQNIGSRSLQDFHNEAQDLARMLRGHGFIPGSDNRDWHWTPGPSVPSGAKHNEGSLVEEGGGFWQKANPKAYKGQGADYVWYSPTQGYTQSHYYKTAPRQHGIRGFLSSPAGMMLMTLLSVGSGAWGLGELMGGAGSGGIGAIDGAATFGSNAAGLSSGALGAMGAGTTLPLSAIPTTGGLFGNGGIFGLGADLGSYGNVMGENFLKALFTSGDVKKAGISALTSGLGQGVNSLLGDSLGDRLGGLGTKLVGSTSMGALNSILRGGNAGSGALSGLLGGGMSSIGAPSQLASIPSKLIATQRRKRQNG